MNTGPTESWAILFSVCSSMTKHIKETKTGELPVYLGTYVQLVIWVRLNEHGR